LWRRAISGELQLQAAEVDASQLEFRRCGAAKVVPVPVAIVSSDGEFHGKSV
jgi:hypothetical protein